jgi:hypothetical protein
MNWPNELTFASTRVEDDGAGGILVNHWETLKRLPMKAYSDVVAFEMPQEWGEWLRENDRDVRRNRVRAALAIGEIEFPNGCDDEIDYGVCVVAVDDRYGLYSPWSDWFVRYSSKEEALSAVTSGDYYKSVEDDV